MSYCSMIGDITIRPGDGYMKATDFGGMAKPHFESYARQKRVHELCMKIEKSGLSGGMPAIQTVPKKKTYVHPLIAVDWAIHCGNPFAAQWVEECINKYPKNQMLRDICIKCIELKIKDLSLSPYVPVCF